MFNNQYEQSLFCLGTLSRALIILQKSAKEYQMINRHVGGLNYYFLQCLHDDDLQTLIAVQIPQGNEILLNGTNDDQIFRLIPLRRLFGYSLYFAFSTSQIDFSLFSHRNNVDEQL